MIGLAAAVFWQNLMAKFAHSNDGKTLFWPGIDAATILLLPGGPWQIHELKSELGISMHTAKLNPISHLFLALLIAQFTFAGVALCQDGSATQVPADGSATQPAAPDGSSTQPAVDGSSTQPAVDGSSTQPAAPDGSATKADGSATKADGSATKGSNNRGANLGHRKFAAGVLNEIPSQLDVRDSFSLPMTLPGVKAEQHQLETDSVGQTLFGMSERVILYRDVYQYDFAFTGLRQIRVPVVDVNGNNRNKNYWYMIYRVRDLNETLSYEEVKSKFEFNQPSQVLKKGKPLDDKDRLFLPRFSLEGWVYLPTEKEYRRVAFRDTVSPAVVRTIRMQEDPRMALLDGVQMSKAKIPKVSPDSDVGLWGVAVFEDVNPYIDYVSVHVSGLTNAYRVKRAEDDSISFKRKTLQLNFWRPGDNLEEEKDPLTFGIPLVDDPDEQVLITRRYALPGPVLRAYERDKTADRKVLIMETDAQVNLKDFKSALVPELNQGTLPKSVVTAFADAGISVEPGAGVDTLIQGKEWGLKQGKSDIELVLEPQYWEPDFEGIRFIKSLDFVWIYR